MSQQCEKSSPGVMGKWPENENRRAFFFTTQVSPSLYLSAYLSLCLSLSVSLSLCLALSLSLSLSVFLSVYAVDLNVISSIKRDS